MSTVPFNWDGFEAHTSAEPGKFFVFTNETAHYGFSLTFELKLPDEIKDHVPAQVRHQICQEIVDRLMPQQQRVLPPSSDSPEATVAINRMIHAYTR